MNKRLAVLGIVGVLILALSSVLLVNVNAEQETEIVADYAYGSVEIDGLNTNGEYDALAGTYLNSNFVGDGYSYLYLKHDENYIYAYFDNVYANETFVTTMSGDWSELEFDVDNDGLWNTTYEPVFGCWVEYDVGTSEVSYMEAYNYYNEYHNRGLYGGYWGYENGDVDITNNYSVRGIDVNASFAPSENSPENHSQIELKMPKNAEGFYTMNETQVSFGGWLYSSGIPNATASDVSYLESWNGNGTFTTEEWGNLTFEPYDAFEDMTNMFVSAMIVVASIMVVAVVIRTFKASGKDLGGE